MYDYFKSSTNRLLRNSLTCLLLLGVMPLQGQAQYEGVVADPRRPPAKQNPQFYSEELKSEPTLPFLPHYAGNGALLVSGLYYPRLKNSKCYHLRWQAKDDAGTVINWYKQVLESNGWRLVPEQTNERTVAAVHDKEGISLFITTTTPNPQYAGYKCGFLLRYVEREPLAAK